MRRGDRAAEGAALEMPCTGNPCAAGSNPAPSANFVFDVAVLDGEVAVPCCPQSALAGSNPLSRAGRVEGAARSGVEGWAPRNENRRTPPGPEGSNGKATLSCAVGVPDRSWRRGEIAGLFVRRRVHGHCIGARGRIEPRVASERQGRLRSWSQPVSHQVLARKWRPQTFDAVVGQDAITRTLRNALASARIAHAYPFAGPRRLCKTPPARLPARAPLC